MSNKTFGVLAPTRENMALAVEALHRGGLVAFPTETVYGLGGDAHQSRAVAAIYETKQRPADNPLIVHVTNLAQAERYGVFHAPARALALAFWPGPLTLVVPARPQRLCSKLHGNEGATIALRSPHHPVARALMKASGNLPVAAPSANRSGRVSPTTAAHVATEFAEAPGALEVVLDGGACPIGIESTVVACLNPEEGACLLRPGSILPERLRACTPLNTGLECPTTSSPGLRSSHYAPNAPVRLEASSVAANEALLAFTSGEALPAALRGAAETRYLSQRGDLEEAAAHLYAHLRALDQPGIRAIAVMALPGTGLGASLQDRLRRAAAKRPAPAA